MAQEFFEPPTESVVLRLPSPRVEKSLKRFESGSVQRVSIIPLNKSRRTDLVLERLQNVEAICLRSPEQEAQRRLIGRVSDRLHLYVADGHRSAWARHCIRQTGHVVFVADADSNAVGLHAIALANGLHRDASLVLVHDASASTPTKHPEWVQNFRTKQILHIRSDSQADLERILRLVTRQAMCVVFSGGGAHALAHVGALLAFEEKGVAIDAVGGTSMGALVAALVAQGRNGSEILEGMRRHLVDSNPICDYTFPLISLVRGRKHAGVLKEVFGKATIENLWKPFFCVSTDLTSHSMVVHQSGPLSLALRASTAIPGILPPLARILMSCAVASSCAKIPASRAAADVLIEPNVAGINLLSFKAIDKAVEAGYRAAIDAIPSLKASRTMESPVISAAA